MTSFAYELRDETRRLPAIGLVVLQSDETLEGELRHSLPPTAADVYVSRVPSAPDVTRDTLAQMANHIEISASLFPRSARFDAVGYGCTSGTSVIGAETISALVKAGCRTPHVTEPVSALLYTCQQRNLKRLAFLSPYIESVSEGLRTTLAQSGVDTPVFGSFNEGEEAKVARIDPDSTIRAAIALAKSGDVDAVFLSCTNLKTHGILGEIEAATGLPAISSNSVLAAHLKVLARL